MTATGTIREYQAGDFDAVTILWRIAREKALPDFQRTKGYFFHQDRDYFQNHVVPANDIFVAETDGRVAAFMALKADFIDHLYVHPDCQRMGVGRSLLELAKQRSPGHVWLYTLQINLGARAFYENNGFVAGVSGISPPPESEPDIQYHWHPW